MNFQNATDEWLVVARARAQFRGTGAINGAGDFGFLLTAIDGQLPGGGGKDRFRIKIWDIESGVLVHDNQPGDDDAALKDSTVLRGGNIVIHRKGAQIWPIASRGEEMETAGRFQLTFAGSAVKHEA